MSATLSLRRQITNARVRSRFDVQLYFGLRVVTILFLANNICYYKFEYCVFSYGVLLVTQKDN